MQNNSHLQSNVAKRSIDLTNGTGHVSKIKDQTQESLLKKSVAIKAKLHHTDGKASEIILLTPFYSSWTEPMEDGAAYLTDYINCLTRCWISITHFEIQMGSISSDGKFNPIFTRSEAVPENKVYVRGGRGKWTQLTSDEQNSSQKGGLSCA